MNVTARVISRALKTNRATSIFRQAQILRRARVATLGLVSVALTALFLIPTSVPAAATPPSPSRRRRRWSPSCRLTPARSTSSTRGR